MAKLSNVVKNDVVKKTKYNKLVANVNGIDTTNLILKTKHEKDGSDLEDKINKVDKKIPDVSDYDRKISDIEKKISDHDHDKYITTPEFIL